MRAFQEYAKMSERSGLNIIETFLALQPRWKFSGKSSPPTEVVLFDVSSASLRSITVQLSTEFLLIQQYSAGLCWSNDSNPWNFAEEFRDRVANKIIINLP